MTVLKATRTGCCTLISRRSSQSLLRPLPNNSCAAPDLFQQYLLSVQGVCPAGSRGTL